MRIPDRVRDFQGLINWLIDTRHSGVVYGLAKELGVSAATADKWHKGMVKSPTLRLLAHLAATYELNMADVIRVASAEPRARNGVRLLGILPLVGLVGLLVGAQPTSHSTESAQVGPHASYRRKWWWWPLYLVGRPEPAYRLHSAA